MDYVYLSRRYRISPRKSVRKVVEEIEQRLGRIVVRDIKKHPDHVERSKRGRTPANSPAAFRMIDSVPTVYLARRIAREYHLAHELLHAELTARDFEFPPTLNYPDPPADSDVGRYASTMADLVGRLDNHMQHLAMFPRYGELGFGSWVSGL